MIEGKGAYLYAAYIPVGLFPCCRPAPSSRVAITPVQLLCVFAVWSVLGGGVFWLDSQPSTHKPMPLESRIQAAIQALTQYLQQPYSIHPASPGLIVMATSILHMWRPFAV